MTNRAVVLEPLDTAMFRNGLPFDAGASATATTAFPSPLTTGGAIAAAFGRDVESIRGPLLARFTSSGEWEPMYPLPHDVVEHENTFRRLQVKSAPRSVATSQGPADQFVAGWGSPSSDGFIDAEAFGDYLAGGEEMLPASRDALVSLQNERRIGLARAGRVAMDGFLYAKAVLRADTRTDIHGPQRTGFICEVSADGETISRRQVRLGGEARAAEIHEIRDWTSVVPDRPMIEDEQVKLVLLTPGVFVEGSIPSLPDGAELVAAAVAGPMPIAGWSPGSQARRFALWWAVPAGSVYWLRIRDQRVRDEFIESTHGNCIRQSQERLRTAGFGLCAIGRW